MAKKLLELRDAPAYMEFASSILAKKEYRAMSLQERGLLYSIKLECWINMYVPANADELATFIGQDVEVVRKALTDRVKHFLRFSQGSPTDYECVDIEIYRQKLLAQREAQSKGGKQGAKITNHKRLESTSNPQVPCESLSQTKSNQINSNQSLEVDEFIRDYESVRSDEIAN